MSRKIVIKGKVIKTVEKTTEETPEVKVEVLSNLSAKLEGAKIDDNNGIEDKSVKQVKVIEKQEDVKVINTEVVMTIKKEEKEEGKIVNDVHEVHQWKDYGDYWVHQSAQKSDAWIQARKGRVTASKALACIQPMYNKEPIDVARIIAGIDEEQFDEAALKRMRHGELFEDVVRQWYVDKYGVNVIELGMATPKWDLNLGASTDGLVEGTKGGIEIKCPVRMYEGLKIYMKKMENGVKFKKGYIDHIKPDHYLQMILNMKVLGLEWIDYLVYSYSEDLIFEYKVYMDNEYWEKVYEQIQDFLKNVLKPFLIGGHYPIMPPQQ